MSSLGDRRQRPRPGREVQGKTSLQQRMCRGLQTQSKICPKANPPHQGTARKILCSSASSQVEKKKFGINQDDAYARGYS
ncbi:hypothetical protein P7K49_012027, partial [Saguinus oedipus]